MCFTCEVTGHTASSDKPHPPHFNNPWKEDASLIQPLVPDQKSSTIVRISELLFWCDYCSVPGKRPWVLKYNSRFGPAWALTGSKIPYVCIEGATVALWNEVHGCLPGSRCLPGTLQYSEWLASTVRHWAARRGSGLVAGGVEGAPNC